MKEVMEMKRRLERQRDNENRKRLSELKKQKPKVKSTPKTVTPATE